MARDYERKTAHADAMIQFAVIRPTAARLAGEEIDQEPIGAEAARRPADNLKD